MNIFLKATNVEKSYKLGETNTSTFIEDIKIFFNKKIKKINSKKILNNCNLFLKKGESVALLGKNGSGKSTFLKILSRISYPDNGKILFKGRIASLLSVVNSLEPDFTGKENIFFLGAGMGFAKINIKKKINEILNFSETGEFKNTPVKRYSTGMRIRLSFAICLILESDIILADEILTVADSKYQKKCISFLNKILKKKSRIILFVSHDRALNLKVCKKGVIMHNAHLSKKMSIRKAYKYYDELI